MTIRRVLDGVEAYLRHEMDDGRVLADVSPAVVRALAAPLPPRREKRKPAPVPVLTPTVDTVSPTVDPAVAGKDPVKVLADIAGRVAECRRCVLCKQRNRTVPGQGNPHPELMFVGEGPGADEDRQGLAFVGRAGQLLTRMITAMGFTRDEVFIGNVVKCRPPDNRTPLPDEMEACLPFLREQIAVLKPRVIVALGATAVLGLTQAKGICKLRGNWMLFDGIDLMPTFHPAYLLRNPPAKREAWEDLKAVLTRLGRPVPPVGSVRPGQSSSG